MDRKEKLFKKNLNEYREFFFFKTKGIYIYTYIYIHIHINYD